MSTIPLDRFEIVVHYDTATEQSIIDTFITDMIALSHFSPKELFQQEDRGWVANGLSTPPYDFDSAILYVSFTDPFNNANVNARIIQLRTDLTAAPAGGVVHFWSWTINF